MKTIKVIELLNKIANGKEVPKKIKYRNKIFIYDKYNQCYAVENYNEYNDLHMSLSNHKGTDLNYEVEILEEENKIPKKYITTSINDIDNLDDKVALIHVDLICVNDRVNKIINYLENKEKGE